MKIWWKWAGLVVLMVAGSALALTRREPTPPESIVYEADVIYREVDGETLRMDIATPKEGAGPFPVVVCIHGGGWRAGDRKDFRDALFGLAQQGCAAVSVQYRFAPKHRFPAQLDDVKAAVRYVREHAKERKFDPDRVAVMGGSAGAHLALLLATTADEDPKEGTSAAIRAAVSIAGPTDLSPRFPDASRAMVEDLLGPDGKADRAAQDRASPLSHLNAGDAPALLIHGTKDELVPYDQVVKFRDAAAKAGVEASLFTIEGGGHGGGGDAQAWSTSIVKSVAFLRKHLGLPPIPGHDAEGDPIAGGAKAP